MDYQDYKKSVLSFFDDFVLKYLISDLQKLDSLTADSKGVGGCAVPQALSTFAAIDLFGYLIDPLDSRTVNMNMGPFLKNNKIFPVVKGVAQLEEFLKSFRDDVRSVLAHRFFIVGYDIGKSQDESLFIQNGEA